MGYTHYWDYNSDSPQLEKIWSTFLSDAAAIINHLSEEMGTKLAGSHGTGEPVLTSSKVAFNGREDLGQDYESCILPGPGNGRSNNFCKTGGYPIRPYDDAVTAVLLRLKDLFPDANIHSDGDWIADWDVARKINEALFGTTYTASVLT